MKKKKFSIFIYISWKLDLWLGLGLLKRVLSPDYVPIISVLKLLNKSLCIQHLNLLHASSVYARDASDPVRSDKSTHSLSNVRLSSYVTSPCKVE